MAAFLDNLQALITALPIEHGARLDVSDGVPVFRAPHEMQTRIEELLLAQQGGSLSDDERRELDRYESLDAFLSLVNRLVRNALVAPPPAAPHASAA
jgi:hypothetical protein